MAFNGNGLFVVDSAGQPVVTNTVITSTAFNLLTADLATGLTTCITKDGQTTTTQLIPFALGLKTDILSPVTALGPVSLTAGQLKWPASDNPSTDVNTMDDYEEGTWTPAFSASGAPTGVVTSLATGWYQKIGKLVICSFELVLTNAGSGGSGDALLTGLPYTVGSTASTSRSFNPAYFSGQTLVTGTGIAVQPVANSTTAFLVQFGSGATGTNLQWVDSSNTLDIRGTLVFNV